MALEHSPKIVTNGLVLALDAADRNSYVSGSTTWFDLAGSNNGTLINGPTFSNANGGSIVFDGTNDYISTIFQTLDRPCTFSIWVKLTSLSGWMTFFGQDTSVLIQRGRFYFQKANTTTLGLIQNVVNFSLVTSVNGIVVANAINPITPNIWYNYSAVLTSSSITLYENGILQNTVNDSNTFLTPNSSIILNAGYFDNAVVDFVNGSTSSFLIYNRALSAAEVQQNFNALRGRFGI